MMKNKFKKALQAAVILSCATLFPWQAMAAEVEEVEYDISNTYIYYGKDKYFTVEVVDAGQKTEDGITRELEDDEIEALEKQAVVYLGDITGAPVIVPVIGLIPLDIKDSNASAESEVYENGLTQYASYFVGNGVSEESDEHAAEVTVNLAHEGSSWYTKKYPILPVNGIDADYAGTIVHEMVHAMGVGCYNLEEDEENASKKYINFSSPLNYSAGLYDAFGRNATALQKDKNNCLPIKPITKIQYESLKNNGKISNKVFYIINDSKNFGFYGGVYFTGDNVLDVLNGINKEKTDWDKILKNKQSEEYANLVKIAWPNGIALNAVPGIPIECYEGEDLDLSHLELQNGLMSHQDYRNWCTLMEAELAVLQDIGFTIDRSKFFGQSIYGSGKIIALDSLSNDKAINDGWYSNTDRAIGLHIYGQNNNITLNKSVEDDTNPTNNISANIKASGDYSMGVRVDGSNNNLFIKNKIEVSGEEGNGIVVAYGKNHNVSIASGASVTAMGDGGIGARFDFGSNEMGDRVEYRGSYIRGKYDEEQGEFVNIDFTEDGALEGALEGALVDTFNVNGILYGEKAIYISPNALVKKINIGKDADVKGDIISEWNPESVEYFYTRNYEGENPYKGLKAELPDGANLDEYRTNLNFNGNRTFTDNIIGPYGLIMNVKSSASLITDNPSSDKFSYVNVHCLNIENTATLNINNIVLAKDGYGSINVANGASFKLGDATTGKTGAILIAFNDEDSDGKITSGIINNDGAVDFKNGELALKPDAGYYEKDTKIQILKNAAGNDSNVDNGEVFKDVWLVNMNGEKVEDDANTNTRSSSGSDFVEVTNTLSMKASQGFNGDNRYVTITTERSFDDVELDEEEEDVSEIIETVDDVLDTPGSDAREKEWKDMIGAIDFLKTDKEINNALGQLLPSSYGYGAMATMDLHRMLSDFAVGGSLAPAHNVKEKGKWHNIAISYDSETDHIKNGTGYKNNHSGMIGAMERTLDDVTVGWHAALNHQSTTGAEIGRLKGDGLYLGAQVKYAPKAWNGWSTFGIARVGIEDFEMQRNFNFNGYNSKVDSDFTAFSGSLRVGGAYEKEAKEMTFGPFAALDYAFAHHPSIEEDGAGAGRLSVESGTYDSLRTQLGYRVQTAPKHFKNETYWQANAAVAWNHELLGDAGNVSASFRDFGGTTFGCDVDNYGRDSLSLMAGMTLKTPKKLDVTFNLGTDIYRHGGDTLYAKCALEWKF